MNTETGLSKSGDSLPKLIDKEEVCERFSITPRHLKRLMIERRIPYKKVGRFARFDPDELADWLERNSKGIHS